MFSQELLINSIDRNFKKRFLSAQIRIIRVVIRKCNIDIYLIPGVSADELFLKIIDVGSGTDDKICSLSVCVSTIEFDAVYGSYIINIYSIAVFYSKRRVG